MMTLHRANGGARALLGMLMVAGAGLPASGCKGSAAAPPSSDAGAAFDASINAPSSDAGKEAARHVEATPPPPPRVCNTPSKPAGTWYSEATSAYGLGTAAMPTYLGAIVYAADLDGDGYNDVITTDGQTTRDTSTVSHHHQLMNRPDPTDAKKRVFVDTYATSGLGATADGVGGRGYTIALIGDLDNDGDNDIITCPGLSDTGTVASGLYAGCPLRTPGLDPCTALLNDGTGHFTLAPTSPLVQLANGDYESGTLLDYDSDGILDVWVSPRRVEPGCPSTVPPALMHGNGDGTFTNVTAQMGLPTVDGDPAQHASIRQTLGVTACDLDGDGDLDILLSDYGREHNQVWRNDGTKFTEIGVSLGLASDNLRDYTKDDESYLCYCQSIQCGDGVINGNETDVDCGGIPNVCQPCAVGLHCLVSSDCVSNVCAGGVCSVASCMDGTQDGTESDVDCGGGSCAPCVVAKHCTQSPDCASGICTAGLCAAANCASPVKVGSESDVGCGGSGCPKCATGKSCGSADDCMSGSCSGGTCVTGYCPPGVPAPDVGLCPDRGWTPGQDDQDWRLGGVNFTFVCGDLDNDGDNDLLVTTIHHWDVGADEDPSQLLVNNTPAGMPLQPFDRVDNTVSGIYEGPLFANDNFSDESALFADIDLDGMQDVYMLESDYPGDHAWLFRQSSALAFTDVSSVSGLGLPQLHGVTVTDLDNDGDLDAVVGTSNARSVEPLQAIRAFQNDIKSNWTQLFLVGLGKGRSNRSAIGARVKVTAGGVTQMQEVKGGFGLNGIQTGYVLTFGLGAGCTIDAVEIRWPDGKGTVQTFAGVVPNYRVEITEGASAVKYLVGQ